MRKIMEKMIIVTFLSLSLIALRPSELFAGKAEIPLDFLIALQIDIHLDHNGSWIKIKVIPVVGNSYEKTYQLPNATWIDKGPAGIRDIVHNIQDLNGRLSRWSIQNSKVGFSIVFETGGPVEIERHPVRGAGAYDINLTRLNVYVAFGIGTLGAMLTSENVIHDVFVDVTVDAEVRNVADWAEVWGKVDREIKKRLQNAIKNALSDPEIKTMFYNGIIQVLKDKFPLVTFKSIYLQESNLVVEWSGQPPTVTSISPVSGIRGETKDLIITGTGFSIHSGVYFEPSWIGIRVNRVKWGILTPNKLVANITIPPNAVLAPVDVIVTNQDGSWKGSKQFTIAGPPSIRSMTPSSGPQGGTVDVTIHGEGFLSPRVNFGSGINVTSLRVETEYRPIVINATLLISPTATIGTRNVSVSTPYGTAETFFTVIVGGTAPIVSSITPSKGVKGQTLDVTIRGNNFTGATAVSFGAGITVTTFRVISASEIRATISISSTATTGFRDVTVTTPQGTGKGSGLFKVESPLI